MKGREGRDGGMGRMGITFGTMDVRITTVLGSKLVVEYSVVDGIATEMQMARKAAKDESFIIIIIFIFIFFWPVSCYMRRFV